MRAGNLDRRIQIQRLTETGRDAMNAPIAAWVSIATVWAEKKQTRGDKRLAAHEVAGAEIDTFVIRYRSDLSSKDRLVLSGRTYEIRDIREVGRRMAQEIDAIARPDS